MVKKAEKDIMQTSVSGITRNGFNNKGFSLVELIVAITLISIIAVVVAPRISAFFGGQQKNLTVLTTVLSKTFDDSFTKNRINYVALHLANPSAEPDEGPNSEILNRTNGYTVVTLDEFGTMSESKRTVLKSRSFPNNFLITEIITQDGRLQNSGTVLIPFYPEGYSSDTIIHITTDQLEDYSIILSKLKKEPYTTKGFVNFETMWENNAF
jgi:prepilin-type N-terminal cleavage/methylation domain-containing protein